MKMAQVLWNILSMFLHVTLCIAAATNCKEAYVRNQQSGDVTLTHNGHCFTVYCDYDITTGIGIMYLSNDAVQDNATFTLDIEQLYDVKSFAKIVLFLADGSQQEVTIEQLPMYSDRDLFFLQNDLVTAPRLDNANNAYGAYVTLHVSGAVAGGDVAGQTRGFTANGHSGQFTNCDTLTNALFRFYTNRNTQPPSLMYSNVGSPGRALLSYGTVIANPVLTPTTYGFLGMYSMGGCGGIFEFTHRDLSSYNLPINQQLTGAAIGLPFLFNPMRDCSAANCATDECLKTYDVIPGQAQANFVSETTTQAVRLQCIKRCMDDVACFGVNYDDDVKSCQVLTSIGGEWNDCENCLFAFKQMCQ